MNNVSKNAAEMVSQCCEFLENAGYDKHALWGMSIPSSCLLSSTWRCTGIRITSRNWRMPLLLRAVKTISAVK